MDMLVGLYPWIKPAHVALVTVSGSLFAVRGLGVLARQVWPLQRGWRRLSVGIDTALLVAGVLLWLALGLHPARDSWLGTKLALLLVYIVLGSLALRRARTRRARVVCFLAACTVFLFMVSVAVSHHPMGALRLSGP
jgi:uncharacterized membrane protein SirB2